MARHPRKSGEHGLPIRSYDQVIQRRQNKGAPSRYGYSNPETARIPTQPNNDLMINYFDADFDTRFG
jgi:hypothetical protein